MADIETNSFSKRVIGLPHAQFQDIKNECMKLPPKKRKNYKRVLTDKNGVKSKVIYKNDKFYNWCSHAHDWCEIVDYRTLMKGDNDEFVPTTKMGYIAYELAKMESKYEVDLTDIHEYVYAGIQNENHTGNHYRNHYISVPSSVHGNHSGVH